MPEITDSKQNLDQRAGFQLRARRTARRLGAVTALEVDGPILRVVQAAPRGAQTAITYATTTTLELPEERTQIDAAALGKAIADGLKKLSLRPGCVVMGVPRQAVVLRTLSLPPTADLRELASMVHMQIGKDLPFRQEEAVIDFKLLRAQPGRAPLASSENAANAEKWDVLVAAVKRETVEHYQQLAAAGGFKLGALGSLSQAQARCLEACLGADAQDAVALISLRADEVGIDIVAQQSLLFSRGAAIQPGPDALNAPAPAQGQSSTLDTGQRTSTGTAEARAFAEAVTIEVVRTLHSYSSGKGQSPVKKLVVGGATGQEKAVLQALEERLSIPGTLLDPAVGCDLPVEARGSAAGSAAALGLALGANDAEGLPFDFLNPKRPAVQRNMARIRALALTAAGVVMLLAFLGIRSHLINQRLKVNRALQAELTAAEKKRPIFRQMQLQAAAVQGWSKETRNWLEQYAYLSAVLPGSEDIYITSLSVSGQGNIHLAVQARSGEVLANLDKQLRKAGYDVKPLAITPGAEKFGYNFRSTVELIVPAKMMIDLSKVQPPPRPPDDGSLDKKERRKGGAS